LPEIVIVISLFWVSANGYFLMSFLIEASMSAPVFHALISVRSSRTSSFVAGFLFSSEHADLCHSPRQGQDLAPQAFDKRSSVAGHRVPIDQQTALALLLVFGDVRMDIDEARSARSPSRSSQPAPDARRNTSRRHTRSLCRARRRRQPGRPSFFVQWVTVSACTPIRMASMPPGCHFARASFGPCAFHRFSYDDLLGIADPVSSDQDE
jgi:hypothetical protein